MATTFAGLWDELKAEAKTVLANAETDLKAVEANIVPMIESEVVTVLSQFKTLATTLVVQFAGDAFKTVTGEEKLGAVVTAVFQAAEAAGKTILITDAQAFAQSAFQAVAASLTPKPS